MRPTVDPTKTGLRIAIVRGLRLREMALLINKMERAFAVAKEFEIAVTYAANAFKIAGDACADLKDVCVSLPRDVPRGRRRGQRMSQNFYNVRR
jgi:hypothetical protein